MRFTFLVCILLQFAESHGQIKVTPNFGLSLYTVEGLEPSFPEAWDLYSSPRFGINISKDSLPFVLAYSYNYLATVNTIHASEMFSQKYRTHSLEFLWKLKNVTFGFGHYWYKTQNVINLLFAPATSIRGISLSSTFHIDRFNVQLRRNIDYSPSVRVLDHHL